MPSQSNLQRYPVWTEKGCNSTYEIGDLVTVYYQTWEGGPYKLKCFHTGREAELLDEGEGTGQTKKILLTVGPPAGEIAFVLYMTCAYSSHLYPSPHWCEFARCTIYVIGTDPCQNRCTSVCRGLDLWTQKCVDGSCVDDHLIETSSTDCSEELLKTIGDELKEIIPEYILFDPPQEMKTKTKRRVEIYISKEDIQNLWEKLESEGVPKIEEVKKGVSLKISLEGDNFHIEELSHEEQRILQDEFGKWKWDVEPKNPGIHSLLLSVTINTQILDLEDTIRLSTLDKQIDVKVNILAAIWGTLTSDWKWIVTTIIGSGSIIGLIARYLQNRKK